MNKIKNILKVLLCGLMLSTTFSPAINALEDQSCNQTTCLLLVLSAMLIKASITILHERIKKGNKKTPCLTKHLWKGLHPNELSGILANFITPFTRIADYFIKLFGTTITGSAIGACGIASWYYSLKVLLNSLKNKTETKRTKEITKYIGAFALMLLVAIDNKL